MSTDVADTKTKNAKLAKLSRLLSGPIVAFVLGALVGLVFFACFYGLAIVNPTNTDWIWQPITHDTAQHQLGWEFYRADSSGGMINGLAYPVGLSAVFMDVIPLLAILFKPFASILPSNFQYFGLWGLLCYLLMGGLAAMLVRRIWLAVQRRCVSGSGDAIPNVVWQLLFTMAGSLVFILSPTVMARSFYHPALAGQWLILLAFLLIWDAPRIKRCWQFGLIWAVVLTVSVLIHPYFLPMMGALMMLAIIRYWQLLSSMSKRWIKAVALVIVPAATSLIAFMMMGGFSQGGGSEVYDLADKGFNLLSFVNPGGYSIIPAFPNRSTSSETMMWLGLGVLSALLLAAYLWRGRYRASLARLRRTWRRYRGQLIAALVVCLGLLVFAIGIRVDIGPATLFQYSVPDRIYELWSAFRAAAREAWPFYYATILLAIYWLSVAIGRQCKSSGYVAIAVAVGMVLVAGVQATDILNSPNAMAKHAGFVEISHQEVSFKPLGLDDIVEQRHHMVALDDGFRGDQHGTYIIGRTALAYDMTLNTGFFARVPDEIKADQAEWRDGLLGDGVSEADIDENLFFTADEALAAKLDERYVIKQVDKYCFITGVR